MKVILLTLLLIILPWRDNLKVNSHKQDNSCKEITEISGRDSVFINPVLLCEDTKLGKYYYSKLKTTVCNDTLCRVASLKVYWDMAGNYIRFDTVSRNPLTKNDHLDFNTKDYKKLQTTLKDPNSILGEKSKDELLDPIKTRYSTKIDGVSGATAQEIKSAVVDGALYSTYTLWHLVNGGIRSKLRNYTKENFDVSLQKQILRSNNPRTVLIGLKMMEEEDYLANSDLIFLIMASGNPLVNFYISKQLPKSFFSSEQNIKELKTLLPDLDKNSQAILYERMDTVP